MWGGPAFDAGITAGSLVETVNGGGYGEQVLADAVAAAVDGRPIELAVRTRGRSRQVSVAYHGGHRFPHLEPLGGARRRLDEIFAPR
jgi:predicted metalloprotease with PDZ domain